MSDLLAVATRQGAKTQTRRLHATYKVGDVLYLAETWRTRVVPRPGMTPDALPAVEYRSDGYVAPWPERIVGEHDRVAGTWATAKRGVRMSDGTLASAWRPPRFMFKALARTWIVVTDHREENLHDITDEDAKAEGSWLRHAPSWDSFVARRHNWWVLKGEMVHGARGAFAAAWNGIYEAVPEIQWAADPKVHVYTFRPARPEEVPTDG